ncbi:MAG: hypothetical protein ABSD73_05840 [Candidatus Bathyarchaeia archaeon]|jgi:hypothetical protein
MKLEPNIENDVIEDLCPISIPFKSASQSIQVTEEKAGARARNHVWLATGMLSADVGTMMRRERGKLVEVSLAGGLSS